MTTETEAKIKISEKEHNYIYNLMNPGGCSVRQENIIYNLNEGFLRIRYENENSFLTFKGKRQNGKYNSRKEIELPIDEKTGKKLESLLNSVITQEPFSYSKVRHFKKMNGCMVCLDFLDDGSFYLEVEGANQDIEKTLDFLDMEDKPIETRSYQEILKWHA